MLASHSRHDERDLLPTISVSTDSQVRYGPGKVLDTSTAHEWYCSFRLRSATRTPVSMSVVSLLTEALHVRGIGSKIGWTLQGTDQVLYEFVPGSTGAMPLGFQSLLDRFTYKSLFGTAFGLRRAVEFCSKLFREFAHDHSHNESIPGPIPANKRHRFEA